MHSNFFLFSLSSSQKLLFPIWNYIIHFYRFFSKTGIIFFCFWESKNCLAHIVIHHTLQLCIWLEVCMSENYCSTFDFLLLHTMKSEFKWELKRCKYSWLFSSGRWKINLFSLVLAPSFNRLFACIQAICYALCHGDISFTITRFWHPQNYFWPTFFINTQDRCFWGY